MASPQHDVSAANDSGANAASSVALSLTVGNNPNRRLLVMVMTRLFGSSATITGVASNVDGALSFVAAVGSTAQVRVELWELRNPTVGAHTITATPSEDVRMVIAAQSLYNVGGRRTAATGTGNTQAASATATVEVDDYVVGALAKQDSTEAPTDGETSRAADVTSSGSAAQNVHGRTTSAIAASTSQAMTWTWSTNNRNWAAIAVGLYAPAPPSGWWLF